MASIITGYEYDIFISYRQKDNKGDRRVSELADLLYSNLKFGKLLKKIMLLHKKCYGNRLFISTWIKFGSDIRPTRGNTEAVQTLTTSMIINEIILSQKNFTVHKT